MLRSNGRQWSAHTAMNGMNAVSNHLFHVCLAPPTVVTMFAVVHYYCTQKRGIDTAVSVFAHHLLCQRVGNGVRLVYDYLRHN